MSVVRQYIGGIERPRTTAGSIKCHVLSTAMAVLPLDNGAGLDITHATTGCTIAARPLVSLADPAVPLQRSIVAADGRAVKFVRGANGVQAEANASGLLIVSARPHTALSLRPLDVVALNGVAELNHTVGVSYGGATIQHSAVTVSHPGGANPVGADAFYATLLIPPAAEAFSGVELRVALVAAVNVPSIAVEAQFVNAENGATATLTGQTSFTAGPAPTTPQTLAVTFAAPSGETVVCPDGATRPRVANAALAGVGTLRVSVGFTSATAVQLHVLGFQLLLHEERTAAFVP
jgi:hypothetical protein